MKFRLINIILGGLSLMSIASCEDSKTYSELLVDERRSVNAYLSGFRVETEIPADTIFETGEDAPYYRIDPDGNVYMQVLEAGALEDRPEDNEPVYFRFMRMDLNAWYTEGWSKEKEEWYGNAESGFGDPTYFLYNNYTLSSSAAYGYGLQLPMQFVGINSRVNLIVKSQYGFTDEISYVIPYTYTISYYPSMIGGGSED